MLVLTRKTCQQIQIGENVVITILQVKGQSVRIGIEAPREIRVVRGELERHDAATLGNDRAAEVVIRSEAPQKADVGAAFSPPSGEGRIASSGAAAPSSLRDYMRRRAPSAMTRDTAIRRPERLGPSSLRALSAMR